jgi:heme oxygenase
LAICRSARIFKKAKPFLGGIHRFFVHISGTEEGGTDFYSFDDLMDAMEFINGVRKKYTAIEASDYQRND